MLISVHHKYVLVIYYNSYNRIKFM